ncbi:hypothetical protein CAter282_2430 [Collimonas arenae]|uniref:Uncharacterized protein n=2 Tax=Collimonas arenae TaxID=279058 RepID=A0A127PR59_9BURK|nr:hypothetical protein CAter10_2676 [Collimonas arenae]AMP10176.1 hypothetical protein CAter282_2430 [Collimonas arenae]
MIFLFGLQWLWRYGELRQLNVETARFAIWERTAYKATDDADYASLYGSDSNLGEKIFRHVYMTPRGANQTELDSSALMKDHRDWMSTAARFFTDSFENAGFDSVAKQALTVTTSANSVTDKFNMGFDPTYNTLTNLKLDTKPYEQVSVSGVIHQNEFITKFMHRIFGIVPADTSASADGGDSRNTLDSLAMITNSWSAPGAVAIKRITQELNPLSGENYVGKVINSKTVANASQIIGGKAGFGGNYLTDKPGLSAATASTLFANWTNGDSSGNKQILKLAQDTNSYKENFSLDGSSTEPDWSGVGCTPNVDGITRRKTYTQDELCPAGIMRARVIAPFDNMAYRFSTAPGITADDVRPW